MVEAMIFIARIGCPWRGLPDHFGPWSWVYTRWSRWVKQGVWAAILDLLSENAEGVMRHRRIGTRCEKLDLHFLVLLHLVAVLDWFKSF